MDRSETDRARASLLEVHASWLDCDRELRGMLRQLADPLDRVDQILRERDDARRHSKGLEARCLALESRIEHRVMKLPRRLARGLRAFLGRS